MFKSDGNVIHFAAPKGEPKLDIHRKILHSMLMTQ